MEEIKKYEQLVVMLKKACDISVKEKTKNFFEVSGYPHYENVISNILAFFFDSEEEHGLKDLWLKSLIECYNEKANVNYELGELEEVQREHSTQENKRLDIIMFLSNSIIAIENKIYASAYNPFNEYHKEILNCKTEKDNGENANIIEIVLSIDSVGNQITNKGAKFYNITYKELIAKLKEKVGIYLCDANEKWLVFMKELFVNIENLSGKCVMDKEWQKFLKENEKNIKEFINNYGKDIEAKIEYINELFNLLNQRLEENYKEYIVDKGTYKTSSKTKNVESFSGYCSLYIDFKVGEEKITLEPYLKKDNPAYLKVELWNRDKKINDWSKVKELFENDFAEAKQVKDGRWKQCLWLEDLSFNDCGSLNEVADKLYGIVEKLIKASQHKNFF